LTASAFPWSHVRPFAQEPDNVLTKKGKYGLKALVHLARLQPEASAPIRDIAEANAIPKKFLDAILSDLRKAGFVRTKKGPGGGCALSRPAEQIQLGDVVRALDGPLAPITCASRNFFQACDDCQDLDRCSVRIIMQDVRDAMSEVLDKTTLADLSTRSKRRIRSYRSAPASRRA
jgi:Rrf2 family protein